MIVWGGVNAGVALGDGARYDPAANAWRATTPTSVPPLARGGFGVVWTGTEMIVWGGFDGDAFAYVNTGSRYNPATNIWTPMTTAGAPAGRTGFSIVWSGSQMIVWGGVVSLGPTTATNTGGTYDSAANAWTATSTTGAPTARQAHTGIWVGSVMLVWGGTNGDNSTYFNTGSRYTPGTNSWSAMTTTNAPTARRQHCDVAAGPELIVWGGYNSAGTDLNTGGRYNPSTNVWTATATSGAPSARGSAAAVWTGTEMIVWGGFADGSPRDGGRYNPASNTWRSMAVTSAPEGRTLPIAVWTGREMLIFGGGGGGGQAGGRYDPATGLWGPMTSVGAPESSNGPQGVWTGTQLLVFGGTVPVNGFNEFQDAVYVYEPGKTMVIYQRP